MAEAWVVDVADERIVVLDFLLHPMPGGGLRGRVDSAGGAALALTHVCLRPFATAGLAPVER